MNQIGVGDRGDDVCAIQLALFSLGYDPGPIDGVFGPRTEHAVKIFQRETFVTGCVNSLTAVGLSEAVRHKEATSHGFNIAVPHGLDEIKAIFGAFSFTEMKDGFIRLQHEWSSSNIVSAVLPIVGKRRMHAKMVPIFDHVLGELRALKLDRHITQFDIWCPRHKGFDPNRSLSTHSWGIACDINWDANPVGKAGNLNHNVIQVFENHGFLWGGRWKWRDDMHFQYCTGY